MSKTAGPRILFVTVADNQIGFGHLNRCLSIAAVAATMGFTPQFVIFGDAAAQISGMKFPFHTHPIADMSCAMREEQADAAVVDVIHPAFFRDGNTPIELFGAIRPLARVVAAIDSLGEDTLARQAREVPVDLLVVPYAIGESDRRRLSGAKWSTLAGPEYALLSPDYIDWPQHVQRVAADRVLVTCGGSDPLGWTIAVLRGLEGITGRFFVRVIVGPLFAPGLRTEIEVLAAVSKHEVQIVDAPGSLAAHMQWCDVAIAASGLTKYELAAAGTPSILFSIDTLHDTNNQAFAALNVAEDLGAAPSPERIADATRDLLAGRKRREKMAASGRNLVDGRGAERLITRIMKELSC